MYPKKQPKSDRERFLEAFRKRVGAAPEEYLRRKLAAGMKQAELRRLYDALAIEIAQKAHCTELRFDTLELGMRPAAQRHAERAAREKIPTCKRCGARMVLRTGQSGPRKGQKFWGCSNYPVCRFTIPFQDGTEA